MRINQLFFLTLLVSAIFPQTKILAASRGNSSATRQLQKMQMQYQQMRMQQVQAAAQAQEAQREHRRQSTRDAAQREREAKLAALHKSSDKPLGVAAKPGDDQGKKIGKGIINKPQDKPVDPKKKS